jgi:hypothetical protein
MSTFVPTNAPIPGLEVERAPRIQIGSLNEAGLIADLKRSGFDDFSSLSELIANCIDARAKNVRFLITPEKIYLIDDGLGMTKEKATHMFDLCRENHSGDVSIGISGKGAKGGTLKLSRSSTVVVYTKCHSSNDDSWYKIVVPWSEIIKQKVYTDMITIEKMTEAEVEMFKSHRQGMSKNSVGTTIEINYNEEVHQEIISNFTDERKSRACNNRFDVVFGKFNVNLSLTDTDPLKSVEKLPMYNYFAMNNTHYYNGIARSRIHVYKDACDSTKRYVVWEKEPDKYFMMKRDGRGVSQKPTQTNIQQNWEYVGEMFYNNALLKDASIFDETNPNTSLNRPEGQSMGAFDDNFFNTNKRFDNVKEDLSKLALIRNNHRINSKILDSFKASSSRAANKTSSIPLIRIVFFRSELEYETFSSQENIIDDLIGVQSNKNQLNQDGFPKELMNLLCYIKEEVWKNLETYFKDVYSKYLASLAPESEDSEDDDLESVSDIDDNTIVSGGAETGGENEVNNGVAETGGENEVNNGVAETVDVNVDGGAENVVVYNEVNDGVEENVDGENDAEHDDITMSTQSKVELLKTCLKTLIEKFEERKESITTHEFEKLCHTIESAL